MRKLGSDFSSKELQPVWKELDAANAELLNTLLCKAASSGIFGFAIPEEFGGSGLGVTEYGFFVEEVSKASGGMGMLFAAHFAGIAPLLLSANCNISHFLSGITEAEGKGIPRIFTAAVNENNCCELDISNIHAIIKRSDKGYSISGTKKKVVGAAVAHSFTVLARDLEEGAFVWAIVPKEISGITIRDETECLGMKICPINDVEFAGVEIPTQNIIARFSINDELLKYHTFIDPVLSAVAIGMANEARESAIKYALERYQGGKMICDHDAIRMMFADMEIQIRAAKSLAQGSEAGFISSAFASAAAEKCCLDSVQVFGGYGYMKDYRVERILRDAKTFRGTINSHDRVQKLIGNQIEKMK